MAAPSTAYLNKNINTISSTGQQVGNSRAVITDDATTLKQRFYLDDLLITKDADGVEGFTGLVNVNGIYYKMHNTSRIGSLRSYKFGEQVNYTDAGLNTLAFAELITIKNTTANRIVLEYLLKSAYYDGTTNYGIQIKPNGTSTWYDYPTYATQAANITTQTDRIFGTAYDTEILVNMRLFATNPEGTYYSDVINVTLTPPAFSYFIDKRTNSCAAGTIVPVYMRIPDYEALPTLTTDFNLAFDYRAYYDADFTNEIETGLYGIDNNEYYYQTGEGFLNKNICTGGGTGGNQNTVLTVILRNDGTYSASISSTQTYTIDQVAQVRIQVTQGEFETIGSFTFYVTLPANSTYGDVESYFSVPESGTYDNITMYIENVVGGGFANDGVAKLLDIQF
ncbi:MAG: hypothetical protein EOO47_00015 [Flavobacterium sp.]|nr:MAG: hypothetical protein EOO47_00015 [Flavobacterium sp.]